jgi:uncharacterized membrane protein
MKLPIRFYSSFYAVAIIAFGVQQFIFRDVIIGRPLAWPTWLEGLTIVAYVTGLLLIITGIGVVLNKKILYGLLSVAIFVFIWAGLRNLYYVIAHLDPGAMLTNSGKALTIGSGALLVAWTQIEKENQTKLNYQISKLASICQYFTGFFLLVSGVQHFLFVDFVKFLIPAWLPGSVFWTYFAGVALAASGLGLLTGIKASLAATLAGWMVFAWLLMLHLPRAIASSNQNEWTAVFEALAVSGILLILSYKLNQPSEFNP